jgi:hypothetical protein
MFLNRRDWQGSIHCIPQRGNFKVVGDYVVTVSECCILGYSLLPTKRTCFVTTLMYCTNMLVHMFNTKHANVIVFMLVGNHS